MMRRLALLRVRLWMRLARARDTLSAYALWRAARALRDAARRGGGKL
jgi:hypothetical protein